MRKKDRSDEQLIKAIAGSEEEREEALRYLVIQAGWKAQVLTWVQQQGGTLEEAQEIFQDAMFTLDRKIRFNEFKGESKLNTFFLGIAKKYWLKALTKRPQASVALDPDLHDLAAPNDIEPRLIEEDYLHVLDQVVSYIGEACKEVLRYLQLDMSTEEMALRFKLSSKEMVHKKVLRCREKMRELITNHPSIQQFFKA